MRYRQNTKGDILYGPPVSLTPKSITILPALEYQTAVRIMANTIPTPHKTPIAIQILRICDERFIRFSVSNVIYTNMTMSNLNMILFYSYYYFIRYLPIINKKI